jgi:hypothetical protein
VGRNILGVVAGYVIWTVLWLGGNAVLFSEAGEVIAAGKPLTEVGTLGGIITLSVVCSLAAGAGAARIGTERVDRGVMVLACLLFLTGVMVQTSIWELMPVWHHLTFLALIVPVVLLGGRLISRGDGGDAA